MTDEPVTNGDQRDDKGRFQPGNPGRRKGSYNRSTQLARLLLARNAAALVKKCIEQALSGDAAALRLTIERLCPIPKAGSIQIALPSIRSLDDIAPAMATVIEAAAVGEIALDDAERLVALLREQRISLEAPDLEIRLRELESQIREIGNAQMVGSRSDARPNGRGV